MSYFLSRLKEQASSIQSIAKNMIVYDTTNGQTHIDHTEDEEDEEVLDQNEDNDTSAKHNTNNLKDQADDFFNSFIPSLQSKNK